MTKKFAVSAGSDCHHGTSDRRGIVKKLHERYPNVNIQAVEYDYDSVRTLRESRILPGISGQRNTR